MFISQIKHSRRSENPDQYRWETVKVEFVQSAQGPYTFSFFQFSGHQHGYKDQWMNDNNYSSRGEGQVWRYEIF